MKSILFSTFSLSLILGGCSPEQSQSSLSPEEYEVYDFVLRAAWELPDSSICPISDSTHTGSMSPDALPETSVSNVALDKSELLATFNFLNLRRCRIVLDQISAKRNLVGFSDPPEREWLLFMRDHPGVRGIYSFSRVAFNKDHSRALLTSDCTRGNLSAMGMTLLLVKSKGHWTIDAVSIPWLS